MTTYEVTYEIDKEVHSTLIEANSPVEATRLFKEQAEQNAVVLCVVRQ